MKKTFRRALACLLAVLMLTLSMPFTALAAEANRKWWEADGVSVPSINGAPEFVGFHSEEYIAQFGEHGDTPFYYGEGSVSLNDPDVPDLRDTYKPVFGIIVSSLGDNSMTSGWTNYYNKYYAYSKTYNYARMQTDGKLVNPAQLKAGQRIAVTFEMGGFDILNVAQVVGSINPEYLKTANYTSNPKSGDTWAEVTTAATAIPRTSGNLYSMALQGNPAYNATSHEFAIAATGKAALSDKSTSSYVGTVDEIGIGKYGFVVGTITLEVLKDCNLKDVMTLKSGFDGVYARPYSADCCTDKRFAITIDDHERTFANWAVVWDSYDEGGAPEVPHEHDYQLTSTTPATCTANEIKTYTCTNADGKCDALTKTEETANSALGHDYNGILTSLGNGNHTVQCTRCDATETVACTYTDTPIGATCTQGGSVKHDCACGYSYTEPGAPALGHDFAGGTVVSNEITTPATCTADGERTIVTKCSRCDATETTKAVVAKLGHDYKTNVVTVDATCTADGSKTTTTTCSRCDYNDVQTETIAKLGHDYKTNVVTVDATCTADGSKTTTTTCSRCDYNDVQTEVIAKLGHNTKTDVVTVDATCTADGSKTTTTTCSRCDYKDVQTEVLGKLGHDTKTDVVTVDATYEADGSVTTTTTCSRCDYKDVKVDVIPMLQGNKITVLPSSLGTSTVNGKEVVLDAVTVNVAPNSDVTLTAIPVEGAEFVGWNVDGKIVSTSASTTIKALANITCEPIFHESSATSFTVTFADKYGNVFSTQTVANASQIVIPDAPVIHGYTFTGWSMTEAEIRDLTAAATIQAVYEKNVTVGYTVTAEGCTITVGGQTYENVATGIQFDTFVTVSAKNAEAWQIGGSVVAYGDSYSFYVGSNVDLAVFEGSVTLKPTVAAVSVSEVPVGDKIMASFLATRSMTDDCTYVRAGFIYGKNLENADTMELADVNGTTIKAYYCSTDADQFTLNYGIAAQTGVAYARAFLAYIDANGELQVEYAKTQDFKY